MQTDLVVGTDKITGTLKYLSTGQLVQDWGAGNFMALKFSNIDSDATSVLVGLEPSVSSGLVEIIDDPDKNGVFKVTDKNTQKFVVIQSDGLFTKKQTWGLADLTVENA